MAIIPWKPFGDLESFFEDDDWFLPMISLNRAREAAINIYETDKKLVAEVNIAGYPSENIDISVKDGILVVKGRAEEDKEEKKKNYWKKEFRKSSFEKSFKLPVSVDEKKVDATVENGVLKIEMLKKEKEEKGKVKIKVKKKN